MEIKEILKDILKQKEASGKVKDIVWIAAGGSHGGFYPAQYFMEHEAKSIRSMSFTSNEFLFSTPGFIGENTIAVICSMRGTPETIEAARIAKQKGASTISLYVDESELTEICDYNILYQSIAIDESDFSQVNASLGLKLAMTLVELVDGYQYYKEAMDTFEHIDELYRQAVENIRLSAIKWALQNKESKTIYVMGSGPTYGAAYIFSICNIMEMLQIDSSTINCCEFFHGPFEVVNEDTSIFLLVGEGRCRKADERVIRFLDTFGGKKVYKLDARDIGLQNIDHHVSEYFNHLLFSPILNNVYMRELAQQIKKDYNTRTYMWKNTYK